MMEAQDVPDNTVFSAEGKFRLEPPVRMKESSRSFLSQAEASDRHNLYMLQQDAKRHDINPQDRTSFTVRVFGPPAYGHTAGDTTELFPYEFDVTYLSKMRMFILGICVGFGAALFMWAMCDYAVFAKTIHEFTITAK